MDIQKQVKNFLLGIKENSRIYFTGTTLKNPLEYRIGEEMIFKIRVECDGEPVAVPCIFYKLEGDDGARSEGYAEPSEDGWFYISSSIQRDGFVHLIAQACDEEKNIVEGIDKFEGGAGADIEKIKCETIIPDDYLEFWKGVREEGFSIPEEILLDEECVFHGGYITHNVRYKTTTGECLSLMYTYPEGAEEGSLKLMFFYMGYGVVSSWPRPRDGYLVVSVNTHAILNRQPDEYYENLAKTTLYDYGLKHDENVSPYTSYWRGVYVRNMQAYKYMIKHPLFNGKDIVFEGGSQGGFQACNMAAHTEGAATLLRMGAPWFCDIFAIKNANRIKIDWRPTDNDGQRYFDTAVAAQYVKCPVNISGGLGDYCCPPSGMIALYNSFKSPKRLKMVQNKTHPYDPPVQIPYFLIDGYEDDGWSFSSL